MKTASRVRKLELPTDYSGDPAELGDSSATDVYVFRQRSGKPRTATWLRNLVAATCTRAQVHVVCPHGLRDTHSSMRREVAGELDAKIGEALGHADSGKTAARHYIGAAATVGHLDVEGRRRPSEA